MSETSTFSRGGDFATSRRGGIDSYEIAFIGRKARIGLTVAQIAKQLGRPASSVAPFMPQRGPPPPKPAADPPKPRIVLSEPTAPQGPMPARPTRNNLVQAVASKYGVQVSDLRGQRKDKVLAVPRHEAMWLMMQQKRWSLHQVASFFARSDHTTVIHACKRHEWRMENAPYELDPWGQEAKDRRAEKQAARAAKQAVYDAARNVARRARRQTKRVKPFRTDVGAQPDVELWNRLGRSGE